MIDADSILNYFSRQTKMAEIGVEGQIALQQSSVLLIGAGGLGCPVAQYLGGAGIGKLALMDFDTIDESNLHRQLLYQYADIGKLKTEVAAERLTKQFPHSSFISIPNALDKQNALELFKVYDIIVDCTDSISARYLINDACFLLDKPWIYGSVNGFSGQWAVFNHPKNKVQYRDLFPIPPNASETVNCNVNGTVGVVPGFTATMQATECIKYILQLSKTGFLHNLDALENRFYSLKLATKIHENQPKTQTDFLQFSYPEYCGETNQMEITPKALLELVKIQNVWIIDVRDGDEMPVCTIKNTIHIPLKLLEIANLEIPDSGIAVTLCQTGIRSLKAQKILQLKYPKIQILNLKGGMDQLKLK